MTAAPILLGSHVELADPFTGAQARDAAAAQVNLSAPQMWRAPAPRKDLDRWLAWDLPVWVHAPYLCNPASPDPALRAKTRDCLRTQTDAAAAVGARGVVVHGGHVTGGGSIAQAVEGWLEVLEGWTPAVPILIENTAGGKAAPARDLDALAQLWPALHAAGHAPGFCLDTCHAWAAGWDLSTAVRDAASITGRVDLVHVNDSRDAAASSRDRHANFGPGLIGIDAVAALVADAEAAGCVAAVLETPGGAAGMAADLHLLASALGR